MPMIPTPDTRQATISPPGGRPSAARRILGAGAGVLGGEGVAGYLHPALGEARAAADVLVPLAIGLVLLIAILYGSDQTCERVFRLLRWIANRPEPPGPQQSRIRGSRKHRG
jgi:hypothetical protein